GGVQLSWTRGPADYAQGLLSLDTENEDGLDFPPNRSDSKRENHADDQDEHFLDSSKKVELEEQAVND
ncbi:MAG TPA: hypothetical protein VJ733_14520, partial [Candidatus Binatia bacterium]|nr:hypothetical protein [Candidatus Binatia bacterium]